jgi:hypothetical protein
VVTKIDDCWFYGDLNEWSEFEGSFFSPVSKKQFSEEQLERMWSPSGISDCSSQLHSHTLVCRQPIWAARSESRSALSSRNDVREEEAKREAQLSKISLLQQAAMFCFKRFCMEVNRVPQYES